MPEQLPPPRDPSEFDARVRFLCALHSGSVSGGPRTEKRNTLVGGHPNSQHLWRRDGLARDVVLDAMFGVDSTPASRAAAVAAFVAQATRLGLRVLDEGDHLHVQPGSAVTP